MVKSWFYVEEDWPELVIGLNAWNFRDEIGKAEYMSPK